MFDIDRILAIPDQSIDYLQMGISGGERAALKDRGFVRKDGIKAKDYMIRTIQKTEKNKAKAEKAIIKGDKPLAEAPNKKELEQRLAKINQELQTPYLVGAKFKPLAVSNPDRFESLSKEAKEINRSLGNKKREFYESTQDQASRLLRMPAARHKKYVEDALKSGKTVPDEVLKDYPDLSKKYSQSPSNRGMAVTYNKKGDLSEGSAAKKIKGAIANQRSKKPVETTPKKSNKQKSDQASRLVEKTRKAYDQAVDKVSRLSDELSELRSQAQDGKSKVATGRTKKRASEMTNAMKFNAALEAEAMNNGEAIPVMRKKANKNQMASLNDRINQKEIEQADALSRVNQLKTRANKLYNASVDYANKPDTATTSATPKSRKVVKGMSPRDRDLAVIRNDAWGKKELNNKRREYTSKSTDIPPAYGGYSLPKSTLRELSSASRKIVDGQSVSKALKGIPDAETRRTVKQTLEKDIGKIAKQTKFRIATQKANQKDTAIAPNTGKNSEATKKRSPLKLKDSLNQQLSKKVEGKKSQGFKVSPKAMLEAQKFSVANQALTNISANTKRLRKLSTGTAKKRTITDSLGNSFTRKKYRFKDKKQPSAAQKMNMTDAEYAAFKKKVKRL